MGDSEFTDRRSFLQATGALVSVAATGSLAGCGNLTDALGGSNDGDGGSGSSEDRSDYVPAAAKGVGYVDVDAFLADSQLRSGINDAVSSYAHQSRSLQQTASVQDVLNGFEQRSGLDPRKLEECLGFYTSQDSVDADSGAMVLWTDWSESELVAAARERGGSYTEQTYGGTTLYYPEAGGPLAALGDGTFAVGSEAAVRSVVDLQNGNGSTLSGPLASAYGDTHGMGRYAVTVPDDAFSGTQNEQVNLTTLNQVNYITTSVYKSGTQRGQDLTLLTGSEQAATEVSGVLTAGKQLALQRLSQMQSQSSEMSPSAKFAMQSGRSYLEDATISTQGAAVTVSYSAPPAEFARSNVLLFAMFGLLVNTAGFLQSKSVETGKNSSQQVTNRLQVVSATGSHISEGSVGTVQLVVKKAPGAGDIDLSKVTAQWVGQSGAYSLTSARVGAGDGQFTVEPIKDPNGSVPSLDSPDDRFALHFDLGTNDLPRAGEFGQRLSEGGESTVKLTTRTGAESTAHLVVPQTLAGKRVVQL